MTIKELQTATAELGFEDTLDSSSRFISAANRALYAANRIRPKEAWVEIENGEGSDGETEIINGELFYAYDIAREDFLCFSPVSVSKDGKCLILGKDFHKRGKSRLFFRASDEGIFRIHYYQKLRKIDLENEGDEVDLDEDICQILPLLIASYVWLDDEEEKSALYRNLFFREAEGIARFGGNASSGSCSYLLEGWDS
ncbi:MAG: hypothetical protein IIX94_00190 [Clostridia bacterium]|nr:hypothetical protein [Clostridia bacterium]